MAQSHAQIKLTPKPINLEDVISFVSKKDFFTCSFASSFGDKKLEFKPKNDHEAQATMAKMELDDIISSSFEQFDIHRMAIHYRLGPGSPTDTLVVVAISSSSQAELDMACQSIAAKLKGELETWNNEEFKNKNFHIKSN